MKYYVYILYKYDKNIDYMLYDVFNSSERAISQAIKLQQDGYDFIITNERI